MQWEYGEPKKTWTIDASGQLHKGPKFSGFKELRDIIASKEDQFARGFTEALIEYSLGRPFGFSDQNFSNEMMREVKQKGFRARAFIHHLVQSRLFLKK
jgi:hypothetical protein